MIDVENSFKRFKALKELAKNNKGYIEPTLYESEIETIIQALEKQIPKKLKQTKDGKLACECGLVIQVKNKINCLYYCHNCGQKIDWNK